MATRINALVFVVSFIVACGIFHSVSTSYSQTTDPQLLCSEQYDTRWWTGLWQGLEEDHQAAIADYDANVSAAWVGWQPALVDWEAALAEFFAAQSEFVSGQLAADAWNAALADFHTAQDDLRAALVTLNLALYTAASRYYGALAPHDAWNAALADFDTAVTDHLADGADYLAVWDSVVDNYYATPDEWYAVTPALNAALANSNATDAVWTAAEANYYAAQEKYALEAATADYYTARAAHQRYMQSVRQSYDDQTFDCICDAYVDHYNSTTFSEDQLLDEAVLGRQLSNRCTAGVSVTPTALDVPEGTPGTYTVALTSSPDATATVEVTSGDPGAATVSPETLTFNAGNWNTPQEITVTAVDNDVADGVKTVVLTHQVSGYADVTVPDVEVTVSDDDTAGVSVTPTSLNVSEGTPGTYTVALTSSPDATATVEVTSGDPGAVTVSPETLTFNAGNWNTPQEITVTAVDDDLADGGKTVVLTHQVSGYADVTVPDVEVMVSDDDTAGVSVTPTALDVPEGTPGTYTVALTSRPDATATVEVTSGDPGAVALSPETLTFNAGNWNTPQEITVTAVDDDLADGGKMVVLGHNVSGYGNVAVADDVRVTVLDNDMAGVRLTPPALDLQEGETKPYELVLTSMPEGTVTVAVTSGNRSAVIVLPAELTFDAGNWNTPQEIAVTAVQDNAVDGGKTVVLTHRVSGYVNVTEADDVTVSVTDSTPPIDSELLCSEHYDTRWWNSLEASEFQSYQEIQKAYIQDIRQRYEDDQTFDCICDFHVEHYNSASASDQSPQVRHAHFQADRELLHRADTCIDAQFTLTVDAAAIDEDEGRATVTVSTVGVGFLTDQTIILSIGGTATEGTDYVIGEQTLTLPAGQTSVSTSVTARDDTMPEVDETIVITAQYDGQTIGELQTITIKDMEPEAPPQTEEVVQETVEAVVSSALSNVTTNIGTRFSAARGGTAVTVAGLPVAFEDAVSALAAFNDRSGPELHGGYGDDFRGQYLTLDRLLQTSAFQVSLAAADADAQGAGPGPSLTVWGRVDSMFFDKESDDPNRYNGDLKAGYLGIDTWLDDRWLIGVAASVTMVDAVYGLDTGGGKLDLSILGVHPYVRLALDEVSELWLILGWSRGKLQNLSNAKKTPEATDVTMYMGAAGLRRELITIGGIDIALLGDAGIGSLRGGRGSGFPTIDNLSADAWRARLGFSGSHTIQLEDWATFTPFVEIVGRYDGGVDDNAGVEIAGGMQYANPVTGLGLEFRANILPLYSEEEYREYGFSLSASASPGIDGEGLAMAVATSLGPQTGGTAALWRENLLRTANTSDGLAESLTLNAEIGYGFPVVGSKGVLTPFSGLRLRNNGGRQMRTGVRFGRMTSIRPWNLELSGEQHTSDARDPEYRVNVLGHVRF